jgi:hypothetical protein
MYLQCDTQIVRGLFFLRLLPLRGFSSWSPAPELLLVLDFFLSLRDVNSFFAAALEELWLRPNNFKELFGVSFPLLLKGGVVGSALLDSSSV